MEVSGARRLLPSILAELKRHDTVHPLFHGSWDWHSACHGHWAALRAAHVLQDEETLEWVGARLRGPGLGAEVATLMEAPDFERPYGRAWFLRLMADYEEVTGDSSQVGVVQPVADALRSWLETSFPGPEVSEYANPGWALLQLSHWADTHGDGSTVSWIQEVVSEGFLGASVSLDRDREGRGEFFSLWSLQALLIETTLGAETLRGWLEGQGIGEEALEVIHEPRSAHHLGTNASRAWGFWSVYLATGHRRWLEAYEAHTSASLGLHGHWAHDRRAYTHWVPQFTLYALLRPVDRPGPG